MNPPKVGQQPRGPRLLTKFSLFLVALSLPVLLLVETLVVGYEFHELKLAVQRGKLLDAVQEEAARIASLSEMARRSDLENELEHWLLRLQQPQAWLGPEASYVLQELSDQPFSALMIDRLGEVRAEAPSDGAWRIDPARIPVALIGVHAAQLLDTKSAVPHASGIYVQQAAAPVGPEAAGQWLVLELRLTRPWHSLIRELSFEWPLILICLILIGFGAAIFLSVSVTRRLRAMQYAAGAWAEGHFLPRIRDTSGDELGQLGSALDQMAERLQELMKSRSAFARMAERDRVARDLHDTVKQQAFALHMKLAALEAQVQPEKQSLRTALGDLRQLVHDMQQELAGIMDELHRERDYRLPLSEQLRAQVEHWSRLSGIPVALDAAVDLSLAESYREELQRLVDEALANVYRHSKAKQVQVRLQRDGARARLTIVDDGQGFSPDVRRGMGLDSMAIRAQQLPDGHFILESSPNEGTQLVISWTELWG